MDAPEEDYKQRIIKQISEMEKEDADLRRELCYLNDIFAEAHRKELDYRPLAMDALTKLEQDLFENPDIRWWLTVKAYGLGKEFFE